MFLNGLLAGTSGRFEGSRRRSCYCDRWTSTGVFWCETAKVAKTTIHSPVLEPLQIRCCLDLARCSNFFSEGWGHGQALPDSPARPGRLLHRSQNHVPNAARNGRSLFARRRRSLREPQETVRPRTCRFFYRFILSFSLFAPIMLLLLVTLFLAGLLDLVSRPREAHWQYAWWVELDPQLAI